MRVIEYDVWPNRLPVNQKIREIIYKDTEERYLGDFTDFVYRLVDGSSNARKILKKHEYGDWLRCSFARKLEYQLTAVAFVLGDNLVGKRALDLGCGAEVGTEEADDEGISSEKYEPWLARALHLMGAEVTGIDVGDLTREPFKSLKIDLTNPNSLIVIPDGSFDLVHSSALYSSPELAKRVIGGKFDWRYDHNAYAAALKLIDHLKPQIERVAAPDGIYLFRELADYLRGKDIYENPVRPNLFDHAYPNRTRLELELYQSGKL